MQIKPLSSAALAAALCLAASLPALAQDRRVTIINQSGYTLMELYGSNVGASSWEEDILGPDVLWSGYEVVVNFDDGSGYCAFDLKGVFENGAEIIENNVNVCEISSFTFR